VQIVAKQLKIKFDKNISLLSAYRNLLTPYPTALSPGPYNFQPQNVKEGL